jgi:hypothetical protein
MATKKAQGIKTEPKKTKASQASKKAMPKERIGDVRADLATANADLAAARATIAGRAAADKRARAPKKKLWPKSLSSHNPQR